MRKFHYLFFTLLSFNALADSEGSPSVSTVDHHAPIGVMGDHTHAKGEWMISYRYMTMDMQDNQLGSSSITPEEIVTTIANRFANPPAMPPTLRVVPLSMTTQMHMVGMMYAPSDTVTLMTMVSYLDKEMDHVTFSGASGTERLGEFTTHVSGVGDTKIGALVNILSGKKHNLHLNIGMSLPTGDIDNEDEVLTPMNTQTTLRLPYPMQLGSGTFDIEPGITYRGFHGKLGWGSQLKAVIRTGENSEDYTLGDKFTLANWGSYRFTDNVSGSLRLTYTDTDSIEGIDPQIQAPVQTADPDNQGGTMWDVGAGINVITSSGHRFALEYTYVIDQDVNGVQLVMQDMLSIGYQYAF
ncbi:transporter [Alteromonas sp. 5E99-2]|uniref:transporter n=1 Tax=Alteromonas sp. 5E99-2 TaxID=2817683 RepID=UPI001A9965B1|nr:transporter [Alteromonas sp. 5E99-2]MBO1254502.1 transporter [Alteromonas sp. 5E99-2]